jgi:hypothetical protein
MFVSLDDDNKHEVYAYDDDKGCGITFCGRFVGPYDVELGPSSTCPKCIELGALKHTLSREEMFARVKEAAGIVNTLCKLCGQKVDVNTAHRHQEGYIGECCWDERLRTTE